MDPKAVIEIFKRNVTEHYFDMKGRVSRQEFWFFVVACIAVFIAAAILDAIIHSGLLAAIAGLGLLLPLTGIGARRLQDTGKSGTLVWIWTVPAAINWVIVFLTSMVGVAGALGFLYFFFSIGWLISLVELVAALVLIYFWAQPGATGANDYGPDPMTGGKK
jgi:uncharacterized membrane protein YhaH (DUF805 family)